MKVTHLFLHDDLTFNKPLFFLLNGPDFANDDVQNIFVTTHLRVYDALKKYGDNIYLTQKKGADIFNFYGMQTDWIVVHALNCHRKDVLRIKKNVAKKIIWRAWGHDLIDYASYTKYPKKLIEPIYNYWYVRKVRRFWGIGLGFKYDLLLIRHLFGNMNTFLLPYRNPDPLIYKDLDLSQKDSAETRIMVGHSGCPILNHVAILNALSAYKNENLKICLILSYGCDQAYHDEITRYAFDLFGKEKVEIIEDYMELKQYIAYLNTIDIAIFDVAGSAALGNVTKLLHLKKKLFFKRNSFFDDVMQRENIDFGYTDEIGKITYSSLIKPMENVENALHFTSFLNDSKHGTKLWKQLFCKLEGGENLDKPKI